MCCATTCLSLSLSALPSSARHLNEIECTQQHIAVPCCLLVSALCREADRAATNPNKDNRCVARLSCPVCRPEEVGTAERAPQHTCAREADNNSSVAVSRTLHQSHPVTPSAGSSCMRATRNKTFPQKGSHSHRQAGIACGARAATTRMVITATASPPPLCLSCSHTNQAKARVTYIQTRTFATHRPLQHA